jgi:Zn-dependent protease
MEIDAETIRNALTVLVIFIGSLSLHEWGHAWMADRLGDDTPRSQGRVTLNPIAHIDPIGTILIPLLGTLGFFGIVGWAKPVMINPAAYRRKNWDQAWVTIAGPAMNILIGIAAVLALAVCARVLPNPNSSEIVAFLFQVLRLNVLLIVFNLLPVPPLDGSKFLMYWFGMSEDAYYSFARWGFLILIILVNLPPFWSVFQTLMAYVYVPFGILLQLLT